MSSSLAPATDVDPVFWRERRVFLDHRRIDEGHAPVDELEAAADVDLVRLAIGHGQRARDLVNLPAQVNVESFDGLLRRALITALARGLRQKVCEFIFQVG